MALMRLDKLLSDMGVASRSELRQIIRSGRVSVDGSAVSEPDRRIDADTSDILLDGEPLNYRRRAYYMMDKPEGVLTATEDQRQKTVLGLLPPQLRRMGLFPVGRLDKDTGGLLLLTNDGDFAHRVISPKSGIWKLYCAEVEGEPDGQDVLAFRRGLTLKDGTRCLPAELEPLGGGRCLVRVTEGKYHQVRRMLASRGKPVLRLRRLAIGGLSLDGELAQGGLRELSEEDLCRVFNTNLLEKLQKK